MWSPVLLLVPVAAVMHLLLAGAGVVRLIVQLPARRWMDPVALARYFRATDLRGGFALYPALGAGKGSSVAAAWGLRMAQPPAARRPSAIVMFLKANWKWVILVVAVVIFIMMVASD